MNNKVLVQIHNQVKEIQQDECKWGGDDGGDDEEASDDLRSGVDDAFCEFPLQIPSGGEVSAFSGVSGRLISDPLAQG